VAIFEQVNARRTVNIRQIQIDFKHLVIGITDVFLLDFGFIQKQKLVFTAVFWFDACGLFVSVKIAQVIAFQQIINHDASVATKGMLVV
jgi:hypothetical protein